MNDRDVVGIEIIVDVHLTVAIHDVRAIEEFEAVNSGVPIRRPSSV